MTPAELIRRASHALADGRDEEAAELLVRAFPPADTEHYVIGETLSTVLQLRRENRERRKRLGLDDAAEDIERAGRMRLACMIEGGILP